MSELAELLGFSNPFEQFSDHSPSQFCGPVGMYKDPTVWRYGANLSTFSIITCLSTFLPVSLSPQTQTHKHTHTHTHIYIYVCVCVFIYLKIWETQALSNKFLSRLWRCMTVCQYYRLSWSNLGVFQIHWSYAQIIFQARFAGQWVSIRILLFG